MGTKLCCHELIQSHGEKTLTDYFRIDVWVWPEQRKTSCVCRPSLNIGSYWEEARGRCINLVRIPKHCRQLSTLFITVYKNDYEVIPFTLEIGHINTQLDHI